MSIEWSDQPESKSSTCRWHGHRLDALDCRRKRARSYLSAIPHLGLRRSKSVSCRWFKENVGHANTGHRRHARAARGSMRDT